MDIFQGLNREQQRAVSKLEGPLLIMAGAGSGKTRVLTYRIANLLEQGVEPYCILAITFTNKAAREMRDRVDNLIGEGAKDVWLSTFHSFCARFLRREIEHTGLYKQNFVIYDTADTTALIKACLKELNIDDKQNSPSSFMGRISDAKNKLMDAEAYAREATDFFDARVAQVYELYTQKLRASNALDFDDLLMVAVRLLKEYPEVREKYQSRFEYIMVDEYQDTNSAQYQLTTILAAKHRNLCVVGDADQSIYGWRGADMRNIMDFEEDYPEAVVIKLEQNYRSTKNILQAANAVIEYNIDRKKKELWTNNPTGEKIVSYTANNEKDEARYIAREIDTACTLYNAKYGDMAILYRTNAQSRALEEGMMQSGIPYTMVGGVRFYERKEIKDILAYLRVIFNPADNVSLLRIINVPRRGLGDTGLGRMMAAAAEHNISLFELITDLQLLGMIPKLSTKVRTAIEDFAMMIMSLMGEIGSPALYYSG